jgi:membrane protein
VHRHVRRHVQRNVQRLRRAKPVWEVARDTLTDADQHDVLRLSAALAFYTALSLAPVVIVLVWAAELFWESDAARAELQRQVRHNLGPAGVETVQNILATPGQSVSGWPAVIGVATLLLGATAVFANLQDSLNIIWNVRPKPRHEVLGWLKKRLASAVVVLFLGLLLLASLVFTSVMNALQTRFGGLPGPDRWWEMANLVGSLAVYTGGFALLYYFLPDAKVRWSDVRIGALATAGLFTIGKELLGLYLGRAAVGSAYGAAGSFVLLLTWLYYSAVIIFLGAEFTQVYARRWGEQIQPDRHAVRVERREVVTEVPA